MAKCVQSRDASQVACKLYHHGLIKILVKKLLEEKGVTWKAFLKEFQVRSASKCVSMSASKKRKAETLSLTKQKGKSMMVKVEKKFVKDTPPSA